MVRLFESLAVKKTMIEVEEELEGETISRRPFLLAIAWPPLIASTHIVLLIMIVIGFLFDSGSARAGDCLGPSKGAKGYLVYLHGFEPLNAPSGEETGNRASLERIAREMSLRIALPKGPVCDGKKYCWPAKDEEDLLKTFQIIQASMRSCWQEEGAKPYTLVGFSNGGYYAFKLYKIHKDPQLKRIIAAGSSGIWDSTKDKPNSLSQFFLMIGDKDMTLKDAQTFAKRFRESVAAFSLFVFGGGHRLDYETLAKILRMP